MIVLVINMHACVTYSHVGGWYLTSEIEPSLAAKVPFIVWQGMSPTLTSPLPIDAPAFEKVVELPVETVRPPTVRVVSLLASTLPLTFLETLLVSGWGATTAGVVGCVVCASADRGTAASTVAMRQASPVDLSIWFFMLSLGFLERPI